MPAPSLPEEAGRLLGSGTVNAIVFADGSRSAQTRCGGWGAWICTATQRGFTTSGSLTLLDSSTEAEMLAMAHAMAAARPHLEPGNAVLLHCDCRNALQWVLAGYPKARDLPMPGGQPVFPSRRQTEKGAASPGMARFAATCASLDLIVFTRHIFGHRAAAGPAHAINDKCDRLANRQRRAAERRATT